jgi:hypothetical protein
VLVDNLARMKPQDPARMLGAIDPSTGRRKEIHSPRGRQLNHRPCAWGIAADEYQGLRDVGLVLERATIAW